MFGRPDLIAAISLGVLSAPGSPIALLHTKRDGDGRVPWVLIEAICSAPVHDARADAGQLGAHARPSSLRAQRW